MSTWDGLRSASALRQRVSTRESPRCDGARAQLRFPHMVATDNANNERLLVNGVRGQ